MSFAISPIQAAITSAVNLQNKQSLLDSLVNRTYNLTTEIFGKEEVKIDPRYLKKLNNQLELYEWDDGNDPSANPTTDFLKAETLVELAFHLHDLDKMKEAGKCFDNAIKFSDGDAFYVARRVSEFYLKNKIFNFLKEDLTYLENPEYQKYLKGTQKIVIRNVIEDIKKTINEQVFVAENPSNDPNILEKNTCLSTHRNEPNPPNSISSLINRTYNLTPAIFTDTVELNERYVETLNEEIAYYKKGRRAKDVAFSLIGEKLVKLALHLHDIDTMKEAGYYFDKAVELSDGNPLEVTHRVRKFYFVNKIYNFLKEDLIYLEHPDNQKHLEPIEKMYVQGTIEEMKKMLNQIGKPANQAENEISILEKSLDPLIDSYRFKPYDLKNLANLINCQLELTTKKLSNTDSDLVLAFLEEVNQSLEKFCAATLK